MTTQTETKITTAEQAETVSHNDLRREALAAVARGETVRRIVVFENNAQATETIFLANGRAGQACGGDAVWGDADADVLVADDGMRLGLDGEETADDAHARRHAGEA